jgi:sugar O-acyltransferase (sialic acid O-acetyltransferase NeuD family)
MPLARQKSNASDKLVFIDDALEGHSINGHDVVSFFQFQQEQCDKRQVAVAIADPAIRAKLVNRCELAGISFLDIACRTSIIMDNVTVGEGSLISPFTVLTSNITIGRHFHCNIQSYVEHDCIIGDFVTFAPGVQCNGNVEIGDFAYVGAGAVIKQGLPTKRLKIGKNAIIGMGAIVTRDVDAHTTVVGNPARVFKN